MTAPTRGSDYGFSNITGRCVIGLLIALFTLQVIFTSRQMSAAWDETYVLAPGYVFLKTGTWRLVPEHPPLVFALSALPLLALQPRLDLTNSRWTREPMTRWELGPTLLYNNDADQLLFWGRLPVLFLSLLLACFVYRWASELYGLNAGLMALLLYTFCPTVIAHSSFMSYDIGLSCFFTLSLYGLWRFIKEGTWQNLFWTGLLLGCALASKTPAIILPPVFIALMLLAVWRNPDQKRTDAATTASASSLSIPLATHTVRERLGFSLAALSVIFLVAFGVLYTIYLFPEDPLFYLRAILLAPRLHGPEEPKYLMGQFSTKGWWYYFLVAYAVKTPVPMLVLIALAIWHWYRHKAGWFNELYLLLPTVAFVALISALAPPLGVRYLLPVYPLLFTLVSRTAPLFTRRPAGVVAGIVLAAWYLSTPIRIYPDYLAYFNEFVGGPKHGIEYLDESNIDWGHNLKRLKRYLDAKKFEKVKLLYWGTGLPEYYGIRADRMRPADLARTPEPGIYIISGNALVRARANFGVDWLKQHELVDVIGYSFYVFRVP